MCEEIESYQNNQWNTGIQYKGRQNQRGAGTSFQTNGILF